MVPRRFILAALAVEFLLTAVSADAQISLSFDEVPDVACNEIWTDMGCDLQFTESREYDCGGAGHCTFAHVAGGVEFSGLLACQIVGPSDIRRIEVDVEEGWSVGCIEIEAYMGISFVGSTATTQMGEGVETLVFTLPFAGSITSFAVTGHEAVIRGVRLADVTTPTSISTWSMLKSSYHEPRGRR